MPTELPANVLPAPRIVKPRHRTPKFLPVVAVIDDTVLTEDGETMLLDQLVRMLPNLPPTLFAALYGADLLSYLDNVFAVPYPLTWQWRTNDVSRDIPLPNSKVKSSICRDRVVVQWFGFKGATKHKCNVYHRLIDPIVMYSKPLSELMPGNGSRLALLRDWAIALRDWCLDNNLEVRPTTGGISAQLLTDPRFYPEPRRKVPAATNERVREHLPGNHYFLEVEPSPEREYRALYIDQRRAHHYHAQLIHFPHADELYAYGNFHNLDKFHREEIGPTFMGLYCLDLLTPRDGVQYTWLEGQGTLTHQFVYSNELPHLLDMGYVVLGVRAAWGSMHRDTGLNKLATWADRQLDEYKNPPWLKPILLSAYGCLACRADYAKTVFRLARRGRETTIITGRRELTGIATKRPKKLEPGIVNVLQRGMIEAATRSESIGLAQHLTACLQYVLQIYADAVIVEAGDIPLPSLPEPWEVKHHLNHYQPLSKQAFIADGMKRLPGVSHRELLAYNVRRTIEHQARPRLSHLS